MNRLSVFYGLILSYIEINSIFAIEWHDIDGLKNKYCLNIIRLRLVIASLSYIPIVSVKYSPVRRGNIKGSIIMSIAKIITPHY